MAGLFRHFFKKNVEVFSPFQGKIVDLKDVPDDVFAQKMLGDGFAVIPSDGIVTAPVTGKIVQLFPTKHAIGLETSEGLEILVHIGIDTVELKGEPFTAHVKEGQSVKQGDLLITVDLEALKEHGKESITPVVITSSDKVKSMHVYLGEVSGPACTVELNN